jgi:hypothetical protein
MVTFPGVEGQMGVYPQHVPLITMLIPGEIIVNRNGTETFMAVGEGLVEVTAKKVAIVTDMAIPADRIDESQGRGGPAARRGQAAREAVRRGGGVGQRLPRALVAQLQSGGGAASEGGASASARPVKKLLRNRGQPPAGRRRPAGRRAARRDGRQKALKSRRVCVPRPRAGGVRALLLHRQVSHAQPLERGTLMSTKSTIRTLPSSRIRT